MDGHFSVGQVQLVSSGVGIRLRVGKIDDGNLVYKEQDIGEADASANQFSNDWLQFEIIAHCGCTVPWSGSSKVVLNEIHPMRQLPDVHLARMLGSIVDLTGLMINRVMLSAIR